MSGQARPPYPPVPRPVSGGQARGAASVPSGSQQYRYPAAAPVQQPAGPGRQPGRADQQPIHQPAQQAGSGGRQVLVVVAVVLALLVLLCAGVISFLVKQGNLALPAMVPSVASDAARARPPVTSYRLYQQDPVQSSSLQTEGRRTL
jgi:serine/threonine-protein kinase